MSGRSIFPVKFTLQFTSLATFFSWTDWVLKENKHTLSERMGKEKKAISESTVNSQRIGIMAKLEATKTTLSVHGQRRDLLMYLIPLYIWKQDHSHFDVFHWNTPGWLGIRIGKLRQCNQERTNFKHDPLQHLKRLDALHKFLKTQASEISP